MRFKPAYKTSDPRVKELLLGQLSFCGCHRSTIVICAGSAASMTVRSTVVPRYCSDFRAVVPVTRIFFILIPVADLRPRLHAETRKAVHVM